MMRAAWLLLVASLSQAGELDGTHPLTVATMNAVKACAPFDPPSLEFCGTSMGGVTPAHKAARSAFIAAANERTAFMSACRDTAQRCTWRADGLMQVGMNRAFE